MTKTELPDPRDQALDLLSSPAVAGAVLAVQQAALRAVEPACGAIGAAIDALAARLRGGGRMAYAGAGSSGFLAQLDAVELPGTYGIAADRFPVILAGGLGALVDIPADAEDDAAAGEAAVDALALGPADALVAVAASGRTPFTLAALRRARARGAVTVAVACVPDAPLLEAAAYPIAVETPPEVVAGSTRMAAGTAQKCVLNALSTGVAVRLGHAYGGLMVGMRPENDKLRERAVGIVAQAAGVSPPAAREALAAADWSIKPAIVACAGGCGVATARERLARVDGDVRAALADLPAG